MPSNINGRVLKKIDPADFEDEEVRIAESDASATDESTVDVRKRYTVPRGVEIVGKEAGKNLIELQALNLGSVRKIKAWAFSGCSGLLELTLSNELESMEKGAFAHCSSLQSVALKFRLVELPEAAFLSAKKLKTITTWPDNLRRIGYSAFMYCSALEKLETPPSVSILDGYAFSDCTSLREANLQGVTHIDKRAFQGCENLGKVTFGSTLRTIKDYAFFKCYKLKVVKIPDSVKEIGISVFRGCRDLESVEVSYPNKRYRRKNRTMLHILAAGLNWKAMKKFIDDHDEVDLMAKDVSFETPLLLFVRRCFHRRRRPEEWEKLNNAFSHFKKAIIVRYGVRCWKKEAKKIHNKYRVPIDLMERGQLAQVLAPLNALASDSQSTHKEIVHASAAASAKVLSDNYASDAIEFRKFMKSFEKQLRAMNQGGRVLAKQVRKFIRLLGKYRSPEAYSGLTLKQAFHYLVMGLQDMSGVEKSSQDRALRDNLRGLSSEIAELMTTYGEDSPACQGGLFNGMMQLAYTRGVPGAIVFNDPSYIETVMETIKARYSLSGRFAILSEEKRNELLSDRNKFLEWRQDEMTLQKQALEKFNSNIAIKFEDEARPENKTPFISWRPVAGVPGENKEEVAIDTLKPTLEEIQAEYAMHPDDLLSKLQAMDSETSHSSLPDYSKQAFTVSSADLDMLSRLFHENLNIAGLLESQATFERALRDCGMKGENFRLAEHLEELPELFEQFFMHEVQRLLDALAKAPNPPIITKAEDFFQEESKYEYTWGIVKEMAFEALGNATWAQPFLRKDEDTTMENQITFTTSFSTLSQESKTDPSPNTPDQSDRKRPSGNMGGG